MKKIIKQLLKSAVGKAVVELLLTAFFNWMTKEKGYKIIVPEVNDGNEGLIGGELPKGFRQAIITDFVTSEVDKL